VTPSPAQRGDAQVPPTGAAAQPDAGAAAVAETTENFLSCLGDQPRRKPDSSAAVSVRSGLSARIEGNLLDS
jgi:hypothetical protein